MRQTVLMLAGIVSMATLASSAYAHHSHPYFYDQCKIITIEGRIERVEFKDPHTLIVLRLDDGTAYTVEWAAQGRLTLDRVIGPAKGALVSGARVTVTGNPIRTLAQIRERFPGFSNFNPNTIDPHSIRRVGGNFSWALPNPPTCERK